LLVANRYGTAEAEFMPWSVAKPAFTLNVKSFLNDPSQQSAGQLLKSKNVEERLIIYNNIGG